MFTKRKAIQAYDLLDQTKEERNTSKSEAEKETLKTCVTQNKKLNEIVDLDEAQLDMLAESAWRREYKRGEPVIKQGQIGANEFYVVKSGLWDVSVEDPKAPRKEGENAPKNVVAKLTHPVRDPPQPP